ncbi:hypothetical protein [Streptomyces hydrogenans]|uniref:Uncharacterized protein n=1 Tax=Streptomyces hydrogenans TaxID=1873719 RepID=A0ABQ3PJP1_9ACTN|nr:hypothetical protein [Streptomyces hydrogenans]GHG09850.1 hypothetical protein GCM10018784_23110 [Streptomyces hydrogenans]GHI25237.1 hypothetical protein Shyd_66080 [Streptomyces hydrogenans]
MAVRLSASLANSLSDAVDTALGNAGTIKIYTGSQPATADTAASGTLLATFTLGSPGFGNASGGTITLNGTPLTVAAAATGTAGWFRMATSGGSSILDGSVGTSGQQINLNTTSITSGVNVTITSGTITMPTS